MPLTVLDQQSALIVVDLQEGIRNISLIHSMNDVIDQTNRLIDSFHEHKLPVILVNVAGTAPGRTEQEHRYRELPKGFSDLVPELHSHPEDIVVTKRTWGAFVSTNLEAQLKEMGVTQVVLTGVATGTGVEATARQAYEAGFNVTLAIDAMSDTRSEAHEYSTKKIFPRLGETGTTQEVLELLAQRSA